MSFVRPGAKAAIARWREALIGAGLMALGLYWNLWLTPGLLTWVGLVVVLLGAALFFAGLQKGRSRLGGGGPGVVQIIERRIGFFGPLNGGIVDLDDVTSLTFDPTEHPPHWVITHGTGPGLHIRSNAEGADALFEEVAGVPGLSPGRMAWISGEEGMQQVGRGRRAGVEERIGRLH